MNLLLTREERYRFAAWLEQEAISDDGMAKQVESTLPPLAKQMRLEAMAATIIAKKLRSIEDQTVSSKES